MVGIKTRVTTVEKVKPPKIAIAIGRHISEPLPFVTIIGIMAKIIVSEVISTGLNRERPAEMVADRKSVV